MNLDVILLFAIAFVYVLEYGLLSIGRVRSARPPGPPVGDPTPRVSVVVAARNEESRIEACVRALLRQDYDHRKTQIVVVDDESEDRTHDIIATIAATAPDRIDVVRTAPDSTHVRGKVRALAQGIDTATGDVIVMTDADCVPPATWITSVVRHLASGLDAFGSFTLTSGMGTFSTMQRLDGVHLQSIGSAAMGLGVPLGVIGNNMAVRRAAYDSVGGYRAIPFSVTEDFALFRAIHEHGGRLGFPCDRDACMWTEPCATLRDVVRQKQRWARGGTANLFPGAYVLIVAVAMLVAFCVAPFVSVSAWIVVWVAKFGADLLLMLPTMHRLGVALRPHHFVMFEFYFLAQALVMPLLLARRTVVWKGRSYRS